MSQFQTRLTLSQTNTGFSYRLEKTNPTQVKLFNWSYFFRDNSRLVGQFKGQLDKNKKTLLKATEIQADYLSANETVLVSWQEKDFIVFDATIDGSDSLIVASNDNCVANSMCLILGETRSRAQVTDKAIQLTGELFNSSAWSLNLQTDTKAESAIKWDWIFSPFFPFVAVSLNFYLSHPSINYRWTVFPCFPLFPLISYVCRV